MLANSLITTMILLMLHAELLNDPASVARGEELVALYIDGLHRLRADAPTQDGSHPDYQRIIRDILREAAKSDHMDNAAYEEVGRTVVETQRKDDEVQAWRKRGEADTPEWHAAFKPAHDFLTTYAGKPIIAEQTRSNSNDINSLTLWSPQRPARLGGFVIPKVIGNAQLHISRRPHRDHPIGSLQIFDRDWTDNDPISYRSYLKIAIGE